MSTTMAQALADRIRSQITSGEAVLKAAGEESGAVFGNPEDVLSVRGNVSDVALTNHLWLLDAAAAGVIRDIPGPLQAERPGSIQAAVTFLEPRDTDSADEALARLRSVNEAIARGVEGLSDADLERPVEITFYGKRPLRDLLFSVIEHGSLHIGQAWGILKGKGLAK